jgi:energy-coupling factor transport system permease protein
MDQGNSEMNVMQLERARSSVHPLAWWGWAITLSVALFTSNEPWFATGLVFASAILVKTFKDTHPWSRSFVVAMKFIAVILTIRMVIAVLIGVPIPGTTIITFPTVQLPDWIAGIRLGGAVTTERLTSTLGEVMIIVGVVAIFAAATSLTSPHRLIRAIPLSFYQLGLILTIATSVFPQLVIGIERITVARRLRGQEVRGLRHWRKIAIPLLEDALERSLDLAAAMESRGFGQRVRRSSYRPDRWGALEAAILVSSLLVAFTIWFAPLDGAAEFFATGLFAACLALFGRRRA